jgi:chromosome partitioning protein
MIIICDRCDTRYNLDDTLIKDRPVIKVRCYKCDNRFTVRRKVETDEDVLLRNIVKPQLENTIAVSNQKGGVAKTSTCLNLGVSLSSMEKKVLLIDFDVQANLTISLDYPSDTSSFYDILQSGSDDVSPYIIETRHPNLSLMPSNSKMALLTKHYMHRPNFEYLLRDRLASVRDRFDYIIIDTPPALGFSTLNALMASSYIIIPTPCEYLSMHGIHKVEDIIKIVKARSGRHIDYRILITMHDTSSTASHVIYRKITSMFEDKVFNTVINRDQKMLESQILHLPVMHYDNRSTSAQQYIQLAREIVELKKEPAGKDHG